MFELFWNTYDKKIDRVKCEARWKKITVTERQKIIIHVVDYVKSTPDKTFRKNPETYLNKKSWGNEIILKAGINQEAPKKKLVF